MISSYALADGQEIIRPFPNVKNRYQFYDFISNLNIDEGNMKNTLGHTEKDKRDKMLNSYIDVIKKYKNTDTTEGKLAANNLFKIIDQLYEEIFRFSRKIGNGENKDYYQKSIAVRIHTLQKLKKELGIQFENSNDFVKKNSKFSNPECEALQDSDYDEERDCLTSSFAELETRFSSYIDEVEGGQPINEKPEIVQNTEKKCNIPIEHKCDLANSDAFIEMVQRKDDEVLKSYSLPIVNTNNNIGTCEKFKVNVHYKNGINLKELLVTYCDSNEYVVLNRDERKKLYVAIFEKLNVYPDRLLNEDEKSSLLTAKLNSKSGSRTTPTSYNTRGNLSGLVKSGRAL